jgi:hypothetical protein
VQAVPERFEEMGSCRGSTHQKNANSREFLWFLRLGCEAKHNEQSAKCKVSDFLLH